MTMNNEWLMENYDGNTGKKDIDSNLQHILAEEMYFTIKLNTLWLLACLTRVDRPIRLL